MTTNGELPNRDARLRRIPVLDGVRGLAILLVLIWHYGYNQIQTASGSAAAYGMKALPLTWAGVDLFFVLSGFLIGGILLDHRAAPHYFRAFYVRRLCRIAPLYYVLLTAFGLALVASSNIHSLTPWATRLFADPMPLWSYALQVQNVAMAARGTHGAEWMAVTWSLAVEEQFYVVLPLLIRFVPLPTLPIVLLGLVFVTPAFRTAGLMFHSSAGFPGYVLLPGRIDSLFIGVLGALAMREPAARDWLRRSTRTIRATVLSSSAFVLALLITNQGIGSPAMSFIGHTALAVLSIGIILLALTSDAGWTQALLQQRWLVQFGTISYGVYLLHQPVAGVLHGLLRHQTPRIANVADALTTLLAVACTSGISTASERWIERPIVLAGQRTSYGR